MNYHFQVCGQLLLKSMPTECYTFPHSTIDLISTEVQCGHFDMMYTAITETKDYRRP